MVSADFHVSLNISEHIQQLISLPETESVTPSSITQSPIVSNCLDDHGTHWIEEKMRISHIRTFLHHQYLRTRPATYSFDETYSISVAWITESPIG
jgi:hypothetical protein